MDITRAVAGAILLIFAIGIAMSIPDITVKCIAGGIFAGFGIVLIALGFKRM